jgi:hypothetical protein
MTKDEFSDIAKGFLRYAQIDIRLLERKLKRLFHIES